MGSQRGREEKQINQKSLMMYLNFQYAVVFFDTHRKLFYFDFGQPGHDRRHEIPLTVCRHHIAASAAELRAVHQSKSFLQGLKMKTVELFLHTAVTKER